MAKLFTIHFDVIRSVSPEYMHLALLGVSKSVLNLWMNEPEIQYEGLTVTNT